MVVNDNLQCKGMMSEVMSGSNQRGREELAHGSRPHRGSSGSVTHARSSVTEAASRLPDLLKMHKEGEWRLWLKGIEVAATQRRRERGDGHQL
jgi:hypothetical protein